MDFVRCDECSLDTSPEANACWHCGAPLKRKRTIASRVMSFILIAVIATLCFLILAAAYFAGTSATANAAEPRVFSRLLYNSLDWRLI